MSTFWGSDPFYTYGSIKLLEKSTKLAHTQAHKFWGKQKSSRSGWENAICLSFLFLLTSKYSIICITFWDTIFAVPSPFRKDCLASSSRCLLGVSSDYGPNLHVVTARGPTGAWVTPEQLAIPPGTNLLMLRISVQNHLTAWWFLFRPAPKISVILDPHPRYHEKNQQLWTLKPPIAQLALRNFSEVLWTTGDERSVTFGNGNLEIPL